MHITQITVLLLLSLGVTTSSLNFKVHEEVHLPDHQEALSLNTKRKTYTPNKQVFKGPNNQDHTVYWAQGVEAPLMSYDPNLLGTPGYFEYSHTNNFEDYQYKYEPNKGYYDLNKWMEERTWEKLLCFLCSSNNILFWWMRQNKTYIDEYLRLLKETDTYKQVEGLVNVLPYDQTMWDEIRQEPGMELIENLNNQSLNKSLLSTKYLREYYNQGDGGFDDRVFDLFINGYPYVSSQELDENIEENYEKYARGGYFYHIFGKKRISKRHNTNSYTYYRDNLKNWFNEGYGVTLSYFSPYGAHAITCWGAEYDENGELLRLFVTDSDDYANPVKNGKDGRALHAMNVHENYDSMFISNNTSPNLTKGSDIYKFCTIDLAQDIWERKLQDIKDPDTPILTNSEIKNEYYLNQEVDLKVNANITDTGDLSYQWYESSSLEVEGKPILNANSSTLHLTNKEVGEKYYRVEVTNFKNGKTATSMSDPFKIKVIATEVVNAQMPTVKYDLSSVIVNQYDTPFIKVNASVNDGGTLSYQWYETDYFMTYARKIEGATSKIYYPDTTQVGDRYYLVNVTNTNNLDIINGNHSVTWKANRGKRVTVNEAPLVDAHNPLIIKEPDDLSLFQNEEGVLKIDARSVDNGTLSYEWYEVNENYERKIIPHETTDTLKVNKTKDGEYRYLALITNTNTLATGIKSKTVETRMIYVEVKKGHIHDFTSYEVIKNPTYIEDGLEKRVCTICQLEETRVIPKLLNDQEYEEISNFATKFLSLNVCGNNDNTIADPRLFKSLINEYDALSKNVKTALMVLKGEVNSLNHIKEFLAKYDRIIYLHGDDMASYPDYLNRKEQENFTYFNKANDIVIKDDYLSIILISISVIALVSLASLYLLKRKEK